MASTFADWCKLIQSIEAALEVRDGLAILKKSADAAVAVEASYGHQAFLARLLGAVHRYAEGCLREVAGFNTVSPGVENSSQQWLWCVRRVVCRSKQALTDD